MSKKTLQRLSGQYLYEKYTSTSSIAMGDFDEFVYESIMLRHGQSRLARKKFLKILLSAAHFQDQNLKVGLLARFLLAAKRNCSDQMLSFLFTVFNEMKSM